MMDTPKTALIATLGGQPQIVTFALDWLLARGIPVHEVFVVHLSPRDPRLQRSLQKLSQEFVDDRYAGHPCRFRRAPVLLGNRPLEDIRTDAEAGAVWTTVRNLIAELKQQAYALHLCIAGGRRLMGLLATSAAALLCDHQDRLWHMYTPDAFRAAAREGAIMHARPEDGVRLIQVPWTPWGTYFPALRAMAQAPEQALAREMGLLTTADQRLCQEVLQRLTPRQRDVLRAFARGLRPQEVAEALQISLSTVNSHKTAILAECRVAWGVDESEHLDFHFLREHFGRLVHLLDGEEMAGPASRPPF
jgi:CRISPR-associated protein Csx14